MSKEFKAGDTITAESLNGIAEGAYTFKSGEILTASKLNTISEAIEDKDEEIAELQAQVEELQAEIDAFPEIEALSVTQNGTYNEEGKAYKPVTVNVPEGLQLSINTLFRVQNFTNDKYLLIVGNINTLTNYDLNTGTVIVANPNSQGSFLSTHKMIKRVSDGKVFVSASLVNMTTGDIRVLSSTDISSVTHGSVGVEDHQLYILPQENYAEVSIWVTLNAA